MEEVMGGLQSCALEHGQGPGLAARFTGQGPHRMAPFALFSLDMNGQLMSIQQMLFGSGRRREVVVRSAWAWFPLITLVTLYHGEFSWFV